MAFKDFKKGKKFAGKGEDTPERGAEKAPEKGESKFKKACKKGKKKC